MANYNDLKTGINAVIKTNGRQEISGAALNTQLKNMIAELGAGYQYMGVATPATNPGTPDANVFYLASEAGTYTNFGGIVINEGEVCALVWNGTWTKQVTGAATADKLNQLGQQVIYDVSANNDGATFASLSALLSSEYLSTLIPTAVRCGGMSIRFVQTSDNKYVQYRLMSETFNTTVANWQGVDDEPTAGSDNLIKSGGVAAKINVFDPFEKGGISSTDGTNDNTRVNQFRTKDFYGISGAPTITAKDSDNNVLVVGVRYYDNNKAYLGYSYSGNARYLKIVVVSYGDQNVTIEYINGCSIDFNGSIISTNYGAASSLGTSFDDSETNAIKGENVQEALQSVNKNIVGRKLYTRGGISSSNGTNDDTIKNQFRLIGYFSIDSQPTITASDPENNTLEVGMRFYRADKSYLGYYYGNEAAFVRIVVVANNVDITEEYISQCTISVNGIPFNQVLGVNNSYKVSFEDTYTLVKGKTVQEVISNIDLLFKGDIIFEQGGISSETGVDDDSRPMQFRSINLIPISANPSIIARDYYGQNLEIGTRFYNNQKQYLSFTYNANAKYVRFVVVCKDVASVGVIGSTSVFFNNVEQKCVWPITNSVSISFDKEGTNIDAKDVQNALYFIDQKEKGLAPIVVSTWNVGQFGHGAGNSTITAANYNTRVLQWNKVVRGIYADLCGMVEYNPKFGTNPDDVAVSPDDVVWNFYKYKEVFRQPEVASYWGGNSLCSMLKLSNAQKVKYACNEGIVAPDPTTQHLLDEVAFYTKADMQLLGVDVKVAICTIAFNASDGTDNTYQAAQYAELVSEFSAYSHVIIMGDLETADDESLSVFTNAGFKICNGGDFGWFNTCPNGGIGNGHLDNIIVKGFDIDNVKMNASELSDHYPLVATLSIK